MVRSEEVVLSATAFLSEGDSEKNAVSEADTKAEHTNSTTVSAKAMMAPTEGVDTVRRETFSNEADYFKSSEVASSG